MYTTIIIPNKQQVYLEYAVNNETDKPIARMRTKNPRETKRTQYLLRHN
jgi:hypothetical protein